MFLHCGEIANAVPELFVLFFFIYLKIGSDVKKGQQWKCVHLFKKWMYQRYFCAYWRRRLGDGFLTVQIFLRPQGTVDANCLGCSVLSRLKGNRRLVTPQSSQTARGICSGVLIISIPEITHLP